MGAWLGEEVTPRIANWLLALLLLCVCSAHAFADGPPVSERKIKAAYLYNFTQFVEWPIQEPDTESSPLLICTYGSDAIGQDLERIEGKVSKGRVLHVKRNVQRADIPACQIVYFSGADDAADVLNDCRTAAILTVGDDVRFTEWGGIVRFRIDDRSDRLENRATVALSINTDASTRSRLKISSRLLRLATIVGDDF